MCVGEMYRRSPCARGRVHFDFSEEVIRKLHATNHGHTHRLDGTHTATRNSCCHAVFSLCPTVKLTFRFTVTKSPLGCSLLLISECLPLLCVYHFAARAGSLAFSHSLAPPMWALVCFLSLHEYLASKVNALSHVWVEKKKEIFKHSCVLCLKIVEYFAMQISLEVLQWICLLSRLLSGLFLSHGVNIVQFWLSGIIISSWARGRNQRMKNK